MKLSLKKDVASRTDFEAAGAVEAYAEGDLGEPAAKVFGLLRDRAAKRQSMQA